MENKNILVVFGAPDPEEAMVRIIANSAGCQIATATYQGQPVHAGNAYKADGYILDKYILDFSNRFERVDMTIMVECSEASIKSIKHACGKVVHCDHHNPGDPGYDKGPEDYWLGSSLGQLCALLSGKYTALSAATWAACLIDGMASTYMIQKIKMIAAGDHCPADSYAGRCQGIDPEEFAKLRFLQRATEHHRRFKSNLQESLAETRKSLDRAVELLASCKEKNGIVDIREYGMIPELPEAALKTGKAYMAKIKETDREGNETGNFKIVLGGHTTPEQVETFMAKARTINNRVGKPYGNPTRGYAGVVVTPLSTHRPTCGEIWACDSISVWPECGLQYPEEW